MNFRIKKKKNIFHFHVAIRFDTHHLNQILLVLPLFQHFKIGFKLIFLQNKNYE